MFNNNDIRQQIISLANKADNLYQQGKTAKAIPLTEEAYQLTKRYLFDHDPLYSDIINNLGYLYGEMGRYEDALPLYQQSLEMRKRVLGVDHPDTATSLNNLAALLTAMGRYEDALLLYQQSLEIRKRVLGLDHPDTARSLNNLAALYKSTGRYEDALPLYQQSLEIRKRVLGLDYPDTATSLNNLAALYQSMGKYEDALSLYQQSLEIRKRVLGLDHPDTASSLNNLGSLYKSTGRYEDTLSLYQQSLEIYKKQLGLDHYYTAASLSNLAALYQSMGRYEDALSLYQQSLEIYKKQLGLDHSYTATSLNNLGLLYQSMGRYEDALPLFQQSLEISKRVLGLDHTDTALSLNNLGLLYYSMGRYEDALLLLQQSLEINKKVLGLDHPNTATYLNNLAVLLTIMNQPVEAFNLMLESARIELKQISQIFKISTEKQRLDYLAENYYKLEAFLSLVTQYLADNSEAKAKAFQLVQQRKAIVTEMAILQKNLLLSDAYPHLKPQLEEWQKISQQIISLSLKNTSEAEEIYLQSLQKQQQDLEIALSSQIPELDLEKKLQEAELRAIALNLPEGSTLVEFVRFDVLDFKAVKSQGEKQWKPAHYLAFILPQSNPDQLEMIDLGEAETIDTMVKVFRETVIKEIDIINDDDQTRAAKVKSDAQIKQELTDAENNNQQLSQILFQQLQPYLTEKLIIAADGELNTLPFEILPINNHQYLMDEYSISYLNIGRDLIRLNFNLDVKLNAPVIFAHPDYDYSLVNAPLIMFQNGKIVGFSLQKDLPNNREFYSIERVNNNTVIARRNTQEDNSITLNNNLAETISQSNEIASGGTMANNQDLSSKNPPRNDNNNPVIARRNTQEDNSITPNNNLAEAISQSNEIASGGDHGILQNLSPKNPPRNDNNSEGDQNLRDIRKNLENDHFSPLPGTKIEGEKIAQYLTVTPYTDKKALKSLIKKIKSPEILHIATHGYFLTVEEIVKDYNEMGILSQNNPFINAGVKNIQNPLLRAGLAFAGANTSINNRGYLPPEAEDGLLTAQDVALMLDLRGTKLVVLSACQTALGEMKTGNSVQGLRSAFLQAGAKSLVISLWNVNDISTSILMQYFYHYYLTEKLPTSEALKRAKHDTKNLTAGDMRKQWLTSEAISKIGEYSLNFQAHLQQLSLQDDSYKPYQHPRYWSAFISLSDK